MKYIKNSVSSRMAIIMVLLLSMTACDESVLEEVPQDFLSTANLYSTVDEMNQAIYALHERVRETYYQGARHQNAVLGGKGSDLSYDGENPAGSSWMTNWATKIVPTDGNTVRHYWERSYRFIQYANVLIAKLEALEPGDEIWKGDTAIQNALLGEAKFFRAWSYRMLVIMYGDVPLQTEPIEGVKTDFVRTPASQVFALIEEDLKFGALHLPGRGEESQPGRVTKGAANHLLSEIYLAQNKFTEAISAASAVIDGAGYALMQTRFGSGEGFPDAMLFPNEGDEPDVFYDLFRYGNQNISENTEGIWVMQVEPEIDGGAAYGGERQWGNAYFRIGADPAGFQGIVGDNPDASNNIYLSQFGRPVSWCKPTNYLAYTIWQPQRNGANGDIRNAYHNVFRDWRWNNPDSPWNGKKINFAEDFEAGSRNILNDTSQYLYPFFTKYGSPGLHFTSSNRQGGGNHHVDRYAMRLSETYLLRAEAHLGNGSNQLAADDINEVRSRAQASPVAPGDVSIDYIMDERCRELYSESFRLLTMMRLGILVERTIKYHDNPVASGGVGAGIQAHNNKFPIPQSEIDLNIDAVLEQNPGY